VFLELGKCLGAFEITKKGKKKRGTMFSGIFDCANSVGEQAATKQSLGESYESRRKANTKGSGSTRLISVISRLQFLDRCAKGERKAVEVKCPHADGSSKRKTRISLVSTSLGMHKNDKFSEEDKGSAEQLNGAGDLGCTGQKKTNKFQLGLVVRKKQERKPKKPVRNLPLQEGRLN